MVLCVDAGNTNIVLGGYEGQTLAFLSRIATQPALEADQYALQLEGVLALHGAARPQGAILSSVVPPVTGALRGALHLLCGAQPLVLSRALCPRLPILIDNPDELGADLLAGAIAAKALYPLPAIVIDMGTATKITAVDEQGTVQGVSIMPGVFISLDALVNGTSLHAERRGIWCGKYAGRHGRALRSRARPRKNAGGYRRCGGHCCAALPAQRSICAHTHSGRPLCRVLPHTRGPVKNGRKKHGRAFSLLRLPLHAHKTEKPLCAARRGAFPAFCTGDAFILRPCRRSSLHSLRRRRRPR